MFSIDVKRASRSGTRAETRWLRSAALTVAVALGAVAGTAALPAGASALPSPIALDVPGNGSAPLIASDPTTQTTYVAWSDPVQLGVDLCILPSGQTTCEGGGPVLLTDDKYTNYSSVNHPVIGGLVVLPGGETVVIGAPPGAGDGAVAWASPAGGAAFLSAGQGLQNGGNFISPVSLFYSVGNAVALSGTDVGLLDDYADYFSDSPFSAASPAIPSPNANQTTPSGEFSRKSLQTDGPQVAAEPAPPPAATGSEIVVGVGDNYSGPSTPLQGCPTSAGTGYGISVGKVNGTSKAAGTLNAAGLPAYHVLACAALAPVLAGGGQDGIGVLEEEGPAISGAGSDITLDYRPFNATATGGTFGGPVELTDLTSEVLVGVDTLDASDDPGTGVYATWTDLRGLLLDYSADGGATWQGPTLVTAGPTDDQVMVGTGGGNAEIAYEGNTGNGNQVFLLPENYAALVAANAAGSASTSTSSTSTAATSPTPTTLTTTQTAGTAVGASISVPAGTLGETDRAILAGTNVSSAGGTVSYALYANPTCAASSRVFAATTAVTGGVAGASAPITAALTQGTYYWQASYSGDTHNAASASACGSEVLTVTPAAAIGGSGSASASSVTVTVSCAVAPCTVTITITGTVVTVSTHAREARKATKPVRHLTTVTLATGTFRLVSTKPKALSLSLTKLGRKLLKADHGRLSAKLLVADRTAGGTLLTSRTISIVPGKGKGRHKK